jgi:hypothetical protein
MGKPDASIEVLFHEGKDFRGEGSSHLYVKAFVQYPGGKREAPQSVRSPGRAPNPDWQDSGLNITVAAQDWGRVSGELVLEVFKKEDGFDGGKTEVGVGMAEVALSKLVDSGSRGGKQPAMSKKWFRLDGHPGSIQATIVMTLPEAGAPSAQDRLQALQEKRQAAESARREVDGASGGGGDSQFSSFGADVFGTRGGDSDDSDGGGGGGGRRKKSPSHHHKKEKSPSGGKHGHGHSHKHGGKHKHKSPSGLDDFLKSDDEEDAGNGKAASAMFGGGNDSGGGGAGGSGGAGSGGGGGGGGAVLAAGTAVKARFGGKHKFYPGTIDKHNGDGTYAITYADGDSEKSVPREMIQLEGESGSPAKSPAKAMFGGGGGGGGGGGDAIAVGTAVKARFGGKKKFYTGTIDKHNDDGTYAITYADGDSEKSVSREMIEVEQGVGVEATAAAADDDGEDLLKDLISNAASEGDLQNQAEHESRGGALLAVGTAVKARYGGKKKYFAGTIDKVNGDGTYAITYADGDSEKSVSREMIQLEGESGSPAKSPAKAMFGGGGGGGDAIAVGTAVKARFGGKKKFYAGTIDKHNDDGTYAITYADGDSEKSVSREMIQLEGESGSPAKSPAKAMFGGGGGEGDTIAIGTAEKELYL